MAKPQAQTVSDGPTRAQKEVLRALRRFKRNHGTGPTYVELAEAMGYGDKTGPAKIVSRMVNLGWVSPPEPRRIELTEAGEFLLGDTQKVPSSRRRPQR